jgi:anti-anti-sigma regulatory factor/HAMP domain-containing protein
MLNNIRSQLILTISLVAIFSAGLSSYIAFNLAQKSSKEDALKELISIRELKAREIEEYFQQIKNQIITFSEDRMIIEAMTAFTLAFNSLDQELDISEEKLEEIKKQNKLFYQQKFVPRLKKNMDSPPYISSYFPQQKTTQILQNLYAVSNPFEVGSKDQLDAAKDSSNYSGIHGLYHPIIRSYLEKFGYYDIFLVDIETGNIVYSVFKEIDYGTSLIKGPYRFTNFAKAFKAAKDSNTKDFFILEDFEEYIPSYNAPTSFIASPIFDGDKKIGVLIFQMPIDRINDLMTNQENWLDVGLGKTGETYLVGEDLTMRSISRGFLENPKSFFAQLRNIEVNPEQIRQIANFNSTIGFLQVETEGTTNALKGKTGTGTFPNYLNQTVLSTYKPLKLSGVNWIIVSEISRDEAFFIVKLLRQRIFVAVIFIFIASVAVAIFISRSLTKPLTILSGKAKELAQGNLNIDIPVQGTDEISNLGKSFESMRQSIQNFVQKQAKSIEALSSPVIPLKKDVILMPLIGNFDEKRLEKVEQTLVDEVYSGGIHVTIIDLTGVPEYDQEMVTGLITIVQAVHLLGAKVILTGVQPDVALGIANLNIDINSLVIKRSLQEGIDFSAIMLG